MKRRKSTTIKDRTGYYETQYDEMKVFLSRARALVEQDTRSDSEELEIDILEKLGFPNPYLIG